MYDLNGWVSLDDLSTVGPPPRAPVNAHFHPTDRRYQPANRGHLRVTMPSQDISVAVQTMQAQTWRDANGWRLDSDNDDIVPGFRAEDVS